MALRRIEADEIERHLSVLTRDIGVRLAGSVGEQQAAAYIGAQWERDGLDVRHEPFAVGERAVTEERLEVCLQGRWRVFPCSLLSNAPGTGGAVIEAPLASIDVETGYQRPDLSYLTGKAVVHLGSHIEHAEQYRRLMAAQPALLLFVDVRYPGREVTADGMFPAYRHAYGAVPTVSVAYQDAWDWGASGATAARLQVSGGMRASQSANVIGEVPGSDPDAGVLYVGAHHDTQAHSVGADDNGSGVAAVLALGRLWAATRPRRTLRLISFGAEEQLSVGSAVHVRRQRHEVSTRGRLMFNFDSFGSVLGWSRLVCDGAGPLAVALAQRLAAADEYVQVVDERVPYADHFPFAAAGLPTAWLGRHNCAAGRFFHHRPDDDMTRVSCPLVARQAQAVGEVLAELAAQAAWPLAIAPDPQRQAAVQAMWDGLFGGWGGFADAP
jgi:hypothetical protein